MSARVVWVGEDDPQIVDLLTAAVPAGLHLDVPAQDAERDALASAGYLLNGARPVDDELLASAPLLRLVQRVGAGVDGIDLGAARRRGVPVANLPGANAVAVAEHTMLLVLALARHLCAADADTRAGRWHPNRRLASSFELAGKSLGVVGFGRVGQQVARRAAAFDLRVRYHDVARAARDVERTCGAEYAPLDELLAGSDVVTVHVPLAEGTRHLIGDRELALVPAGAVLVNVSRGGVVDEDALAAALERGHLAGAGVDVWVDEPVRAGNRLAALPNVVATPHAAAQTRDTVRRVIDQAMANIARAHRGEQPLHLVG